MWRDTPTCKEIQAYIPLKQGFPTAISIMSVRSSGSAPVTLQLCHQQVWLYGCPHAPRIYLWVHLSPGPHHSYQALALAMSCHLPGAQASLPACSQAGRTAPPAPQMLATLPISVPKALANSTCLEKAPVSINCSVFSISSFA